MEIFVSMTCIHFRNNSVTTNDNKTYVDVFASYTHRHRKAHATISQIHVRPSVKNNFADALIRIWTVSNCA